MRRRAASALSTMRAREARSSCTLARSSASRRSFSSASAAAPPTARTSSGSSASEASWTSIATGRPSLLDRRASRAPSPGPGSVKSAPGAVDPLAGARAASRRAAATGRRARRRARRAARRGPARRRGGPTSSLTAAAPATRLRSSPARNANGTVASAITRARSSVSCDVRRGAGGPEDRPHGVQREHEPAAEVDRRERPPLRTPSSRVQRRARTTAEHDDQDRDQPEPQPRERVEQVRDRRRRAAGWPGAPTPRVSWNSRQTHQPTVATRYAARSRARGPRGSPAAPTGRRAGCGRGSRRAARSASRPSDERPRVGRDDQRRTGSR